MSQPRHENEPVYDVLGVGFGPSNLALGIAIEEFNRTVGSEAPLRAVFLEKQATFGWHRGMLIDDAIVMIEPRVPSASMRRTADCMASIVPVVLISNTRFHSSSGTCVNRCAGSSAIAPSS